MELLSNLIWAAVAILLWGLWLAHRRPAGSRFLLPGRAAQLTALAMLTAILLPVISVSDDLQASQNPAEVERIASRSDQHGLLFDRMHPAPTVLQPPGVAAIAGPFPMALVIADIMPLLPRTGHIRLSWSRPPPTL